GEESCQAAREGGLGAALVTAEEHATEARFDRGEDQRRLGVVLADDRRKRQHCHRHSSHASASRIASRSARSACALAFHSPRSDASSSRSAIERSAHGLDASKNFRTSGSVTYASVTRSYIQSSTT